MEITPPAKITPPPFKGSRFLASSDHLLPLFHVNEKAEAQLICLACITIIIFYFSAFFKRRLPPS